MRRLLDIAIVSASLLLPMALLGVEARDFYGHWQLPEPAGDTCFLIVKPGGRASCFWSGADDNRIDRGRWEMLGEKLLIEWRGGYRYVLTKLDQNTIRRASYAPGTALTDAPENEVVGTAYSDELVGSLTVEASEPRGPDRRESAAGSAALARSPFVGYWQVADSRGRFGEDRGFFLSLERGGAVASALREWSAEFTNQKGAWRAESGGALILWPSGHAERFVETAEGYELLLYGRGEDPGGEPEQRRRVRRADLVAARAFFEAGTTHFLAADDIVGYWLTKEVLDGEILQIERFGEAFLFSGRRPEEKLSGAWNIRQDRVHIEWTDGSNDFLGRTSRGWMRTHFAPGLPTTGESTSRERMVRGTHGEFERLVEEIAKDEAAGR